MYQLHTYPHINIGFMAIFKENMGSAVALYSSSHKKLSKTAISVLELRNQ